jgi:hypothetical protein
MNHYLIYITRPGSRVHTVLVPMARYSEIVEEYRILGWEVYE